MTNYFSVLGESGDDKIQYKYSHLSPLVNNEGNPLRCLYTPEMTRIVEISESAQNPETTNARDIPAFLFFDLSPDRTPYPFEVNIQKNMSKYYCRLESNINHKDTSGSWSGYYPDNPKAMQNIIGFHALLALRDLQEKNHPLPMTMVYQMGMNDNHAGIVAIRISSLIDPGKNEIMIINSLGGYSEWEGAAIEGLSCALKHKATSDNQDKKPEIITITPTTHSGVAQADYGMQGYCAGITATMSCAISPDLSFSAQKEKLVSHMRSICGKENEALLRQDHQKLLALSHPLDVQFNLEAAKKVLSECQKHHVAKNQTEISQKSPELEVLEQALSKELRDIKLKNIALNAEKPGFFSSSESVRLAKEKANILDNLLNTLNKASTVEQYLQTVEQFIDSDEYRTISNARRIGYQIMGWKGTSCSLIDDFHEAIAQHITKPSGLFRMG